GLDLDLLVAGQGRTPNVSRELECDQALLANRFSWVVADSLGAGWIVEALARSVNVDYRDLGCRECGQAHQQEERGDESGEFSHGYFTSAVWLDLSRLLEARFEVRKSLACLELVTQVSSTVPFGFIFATETLWKRPCRLMDLEPL